MKNYIFIHAANLLRDKNNNPNVGRCQGILDNIAEYIMTSRIYEDVEAINVELLGDPNIHFNVPKAVVHHNGTDYHQWEFPTLNKVRDFAKSNHEANILYLHTKGSSNHIRVPEISWIEDVRNYQLYQTVLRYRECLEYLKEYDACGAELLSTPVNHYSQNFWWARASHINTLINPRDLPVIFDERHQCEFWIGSNPNARYKSIFNLYNHYIDAVDFSPCRYIGKK